MNVCYNHDQLSLYQSKVESSSGSHGILFMIVTPIRQRNEYLFTEDKGFKGFELGCSTIHT